MSDFLFYDRKNNHTFTELENDEEVCKRIELKIPEKRIKKVIQILEDRTNDWRFIKGGRSTRKVLKENIMFVSLPMFLLYMPQYYQRIFFKIAMLCSRKPGKGFGYCEITITEFYMILSDWDRIRFKEVFKFFINNDIIKIENSGYFRINQPYSFGVFGFNFHLLELMEKTFNKFQNRIFKAKTNVTFITDFEKI